MRKQPAITEHRGVARVSSESLVLSVDVGTGGEPKPGDLVVVVVERGTSTIELRRALSAIYEAHGLPPPPSIPGEEETNW